MIFFLHRKTHFSPLFKIPPVEDLDGGGGGQLISKERLCKNCFISTICQITSVLNQGVGCHSKNQIEFERKKSVERERERLFERHVQSYLISFEKRH